VYCRPLLAIVGGLCLLAPPWAAAQSAFPHGVAAGDVTHDTAVLWCRANAAGQVRLDVATDDLFQTVVATQVSEANEADDFTLKFDLEGLSPTTAYFYRFVRLDASEASVSGTFRTAPPPEAPQALRFVHSGDSNARAQPFDILAYAAAEQPDFWFWAGDTAYADGVADGLPPAVDLSGYRGKHRQNRDDEHLRGLLAAAPVWVQWDDHEVANDYDGGELEPHLTASSVADAYRAFFDYMPIRRQGIADDPQRIYRSFRYGSLAEFFILDCRQYRSADVGRQGGGPDPRAFLLPTLEFGTIALLADPARTMLGTEQLDWLKAGLASSTATWKFVLSSVPFSSLLFLPYDRWDGYVAERYDILRFIDLNNVTGVVLLSADIHGNVYNPDVTRFLRDTVRQEFSPCFRIPEFIAGPIATDTLREEIAGVGAAIFGIPTGEFDGTLLFDLGFGFLVDKIVAANQLRFVEPNRFAYLVVDVTPDGVTLTHKGIAPGQAAAEIETLHAASLPEPASCFPAPLLPACACLAIADAVRRYRPTPPRLGRAGRRV